MQWQQRVSDISLIAFAAGTGLAVRLPAPLAPEPVAVLFCLAACVVGMPSGRVVVPLVVGFLWGAMAFDARLAGDVPRSLEGETLRLSGTIVGLPERRPINVIFRFRAEVPWNSEPVNLRVVAPAGFEPGAHRHWQLSVRVRRRHGTQNPGQFNYADWLFANGMAGTGVLVEPETAVALALQAMSPLTRIRRQIADSIVASTPPSPGRGILVALATGAGEQIDAATWAVLSATGTSHLVVISGLHVGAVVLVTLGALRYLRVSPRTSIPATMLVTLMYAGIAGFGLSVQRATLAALAALAALGSNRAVGAGRLWCIALAGVCALDPFASLKSGFWLSFGAVALLLIVFAGQHRSSGERLRWPKELLRAQLVIGAGLLPVSIVVLGHWAPAGSLANLVAVPIVTMLVIPALLVLTVVLLLGGEVGRFVAGYPLAILAGLLDGLVVLLEELASHLPPFLVAADLMDLIPALVGGVTLVLPIGWRLRATGCLLLLLLFVPDVTVPEKGELWVDVIDVGQGLAILLRTRSSTILYDAGPRFGEGFDAGRKIVAPYLVRAGVRRLDWLVVSHKDADHAGGVPAIRDMFAPLSVAGPTFAAGCRYQSWRTDGIVFTLFRARLHERNDGSCMLYARGEDFALLLPGDIERDAERRLVDWGPTGVLAAAFPGGAGNNVAGSPERPEWESDGEGQPDLLAADILVVPHHGSLSSSTPAFLNRVQPRYAIVSAGYANRFGHPHARVLARYEARRIPVLNTARSGAVQIRLGPGTLSIVPTAAGTRATVQ